jgi:hypothetical protein
MFILCQSGRLVTLRELPPNGMAAQGVAAWRTAWSKRGVLPPEPDSCLERSPYVMVPEVRGVGDQC